MKIFLLTTLIFLNLLMPQQGLAQDVSVEAEVNIQKVVFDSFIRFTIRVNGTQNASPIELPAIEGFKSRYLGPSRQTSIFNGQYTGSITFGYSLFPVKTGKFEIPAVTLNVDGQDYTTQPISVEVIDSPGSISSSQGKSFPAGSKDKIFMALKLPKQKVYLNEQLPVKILFFVTGFSVKDIHLPELKALGVHVEDYEQPRQYRQVINGTRYEIIEFNTVIYSTRTGKITLGPVTLQCNQVIRTSQGGSPFGSGGGFFNDSFFNSFFDSYEKKPLTIQSEEVVLNVLSLPENGKPNGFSGGVGQFSFDASASPQKVKVGDPVTLRMKIGGKGNLGRVHFPEFKWTDQFKTYAPDIKEEDGNKVLEQVIIPKFERITEIPAMKFSYFDTTTGQYKTVTKGPFPLEVEAVRREESFKVVGLGRDELRVGRKQETLGQDIIFIKDDMGKLRQAGHYFYRTFLFYTLFFLVGGLFIVAYVGYQRAHRLETDVVYARRLHAPQKARKGLKEAKHLMDSSKVKEFYNVLFKTFQHYFGNKFHLSSGAVGLEAIQTRLKPKEKYQKVLEAIKSVFEECDAVRYASAQIDQKYMAGSYQRVEQVIDYLERNL